MRRHDKTVPANGAGCAERERLRRVVGYALVAGRYIQGFLQMVALPGTAARRAGRHGGRVRHDKNWHALESSAAVCVGHLL